jgi:hypothetical protein
LLSICLNKPHHIVKDHLMCHIKSGSLRSVAASS